MAEDFASTCRRLGWTPPAGTYPTCRECGHHFRVGGEYLCRQRETDTPEMFTIRLCSQMRDSGACGPEGVLWVQRPSWWRRLLTYLFVPRKAGW